MIDKHRVGVEELLENLIHYYLARRLRQKNLGNRGMDPYRKNNSKTYSPFPIRETRYGVFEAKTHIWKNLG